MAPQPKLRDRARDECIGVLEGVVGGRSHLVGWSDGGIVALFVAMRRPELVDRMVLIGTNFHHDGVFPLELSEDSPVAAQLFEAYAARSPDGPDHFGVLFEKFLVMATTEPTLSAGDIAAITAPTLVMVGDDDLPDSLTPVSCTKRSPPDSCASYRPPRTLPIERPADVARNIHRQADTGRESVDRG